ncbi:MAG TPA: branched-chain amino acid ABC transporter permease [Candidatus Limnocylindrales bacterium]|nr:branched-chain amino acid ABC transporter permease [Candidatus Limnocylindrales bacterium]
MEELAKALTIGLNNGLIIALIAIGYTLVYGILELINFAHADVFMLGTAFTFYVTEVIVRVLGIPAGSGLALLLTFASLPLVMIFTAVINASIERTAYRPLRNAPRLAPLISAIGMSFVLQNVGLVLLGPSQKAVEPVLPRTDILTFPNGASWFGLDELMVLAVTIPLLLGLRWFVGSTRQGKAMRATAQDREASGLMGIDVNRTISLTFLIAGALAGAAGLVVALYYGQTFFQYGFQFGLLSFTAAVLGGIGNLTGAAMGGIVIGLIGALSDRFLEAKWTSVIVFTILILVLIFRPTGLLAEKQSERA